MKEENTKEFWLLYIDGAFINKESKVGLILPKGFNIYYAIRLNFSTTKNEEKYEAILAGLGLAKALRVNNLKIYSNS